VGLSILATYGLLVFGLAYRNKKAMKVWQWMLVKWSLLRNGGTSLELVLATDQEAPVTSPDRGFVIRIWSSNTISCYQRHNL
jgi:hypothetical protein